jgi:hypothetical protein
MGKRTYRVLMWKSDGIRPLGRLRIGFKDNIEMDFSRTGLGACTVLIWLRTGTGGGLL